MDNSPTDSLESDGELVVELTSTATVRFTVLYDEETGGGLPPSFWKVTRVRLFCSNDVRRVLKARAFVELFRGWVDVLLLGRHRSGIRESQVKQVPNLLV